MLPHRMATVKMCSLDRGRENKRKGCTKASEDGEACGENHHDESGSRMNGTRD